jgi:hypothetical protein
MATFLLDALASHPEIRVSFDGVARASSALSTCRECVASMNIAHLK